MERCTFVGARQNDLWTWARGKKKMDVYFKPGKKLHSATAPLAFILPSLKALGKASCKGVTLRNSCNAQEREDTSYFMQLIIFFPWFLSLQESARKELLASHPSGKEGRTHSLEGLQTPGAAKSTPLLCLGWSCNYPRPWNNNHNNDPC